MYCILYKFTNITNLVIYKYLKWLSFLLLIKMSTEIFTSEIFQLHINLFQTLKLKFRLVFRYFIRW